MEWVLIGETSAVPLCLQNLTEMLGSHNPRTTMPKGNLQSSSPLMFTVSYPTAPKKIL